MEAAMTEYSMSVQVKSDNLYIHFKEKWVKFSQKLSKIGIDGTVMYDPPNQEFLELTKAHGLTINLNKKRVKNIG